MIGWAEAIGWFGTVTYLVAYGLLAARILPAGRIYYLANVVAALAVALVSVTKGTWQAVAINLVWALVSVYGVVEKAPPTGGLRPRPARLGVGALLVTGLGALALGHTAAGITVLGWTSFAAFTLGYALFTARRLPVREFHLWNFVAATSLLPELWNDANWSVFVLEASWALAAVWGLANPGDAPEGEPAP